MFVTPDQILWSEGAGLGRINVPRFEKQHQHQEEVAAAERAAQRFQALRDQLSEAKRAVSQWIAHARELESQAPRSLAGRVSSVRAGLEDMRIAVDRASSEVDAAENAHDAAYYRVARGGGRGPFTNPKGMQEWDAESYHTSAKQAAASALSRFSASVGAELDSIQRAIQEERERELRSEQDRIAREEAERAEQERLAREEERWRQQEEAARAAEQARLDRQAEMDAQRAEREYALEQARWQAEQDRIAREQEARLAAQEAERQRAELQFQLELMRSISEQQKAAGQPGLVPTVGYDPATGQAVVQYGPAPSSAPAMSPYGGAFSPYGMPGVPGVPGVPGMSPYAAQGLPGYAPQPQPQQPQILAAGGGWSGQAWTPGGHELFGMRGLGATRTETVQTMLNQALREDQMAAEAERRLDLAAAARHRANAAELRSAAVSIEPERDPGRVSSPQEDQAGPSAVDQAAGIINVFGDAASRFADIYSGRDRQPAPVQAGTGTMLGLGGLGGLLLAGVGIYAGIKMIDGSGRGRGRRRR